MSMNYELFQIVKEKFIGYVAPGYGGLFTVTQVITEGSIVEKANEESTVKIQCKLIAVSTEIEKEFTLEARYSFTAKDWVEIRVSPDSVLKNRN